MTESIGEFREVEEILEQLPASRRDEVLHRAGRGDMPYLKEDLKLEPGRALFPGLGWIDVPGLEPMRVPIDDIELFFLIQRGEGMGN